MATKTIIRCKINRDHGTIATIGGHTYHFKPRPELGASTAHVAVVEQREHISRFLRVDEAYELFYGEEEGDAPRVVAPAVPDDEPAPAGEPEPDAEAAEDDEDDGEDGLDVDMSVPLDQHDEASLRAIFKRLNGRAARKDAKRETLIAKIEEMLEEQT